MKTLFKAFLDQRSENRKALIYAVGMKVFSLVVDSKMISILISNFNAILLSRGLLRNVLSVGSAAMIAFFAIHIHTLAIGLGTVGIISLYLSIFATHDFSCQKMFLELPSSQEHIIIKEDKTFLNFISEDGMTGKIVEPRLKWMEEGDELIKVEPLGEETEIFPSIPNETTVPKETATRKIKVPHVNKKRMKTMSELIREENNAQYNAAENVQQNIVNQNVVNDEL